MNADPYTILKRLSESNDKTTLKRRIHIYRINYTKQAQIQRYLDRLERLISIRR